MNPHRSARLSLRLWLALGLGLAGCTATPTPAPELSVVRVAVTDLTAPLLADLAAAYRSHDPAVSLAPITTTVSQLASSGADFALTASPDPGQFATPLGYVPLAVVVHPANPLAGLTLTQTQEIFAGRLVDWAQAGVGTGGEIHVVSREPGSDGGRAFEAEVLRGGSPSLAALVAPGWAEMRQAVGEDPSAIGYLPGPEVNSAVKVLSLDATARVLIVATAPGEPQGAARDFLAWAQGPAGQAAVAERHQPLN